MPVHRTALVMIARNEARCIARSLRRLRPWLDEMIVLDTGSTDETQRIAADEGPRVAHFAWVDDFSAARNAALDLSDADWNIVADADEHLAEGGRCFAFSATDGTRICGQIGAIQHAPAESSKRRINPYAHGIQLAPPNSAQDRAIHRLHTRATLLRAATP